MLIIVHFKTGVEHYNAVQGLQGLVKVADTVDIEKPRINIYVKLENAVSQTELNECLNEFIRIIQTRKHSYYLKIERMPEPESCNSGYHPVFDVKGNIKQGSYMITI